MPYVLLRHKVRDYASWRAVFDGALGYRKAFGEISYQVFRDASEPLQVFGLFEWDSIDRAKKFFGSHDLRYRMKQAGVTDEPHFYYLDSV